MWHVSASVTLNPAEGPILLDELNDGSRLYLRMVCQRLLAGVGEDPGKWGPPSDREPSPLQGRVLHYKRRLTDAEIADLPGGLTIPAVDPE